jgi:hypothetical protein
MKNSFYKHFIILCIIRLFFFEKKLKFEQIYLVNLLILNESKLKCIGEGRFQCSRVMHQIYIRLG